MESLTLQLPIPGRVLSQNARGHWAAKAKATREARAAAKAEGLRVLDKNAAPRWAKVRCQVVLFARRAVQMDPTNLMGALKAYIDGIGDAKIIANDRNLWPERPEYRIDPAERFPRVEITITPES